MAMNGNATFAKAPGLESLYQVYLSVIKRTLVDSGSYSSAEVHSEKSAAQADIVEKI